MSRRAFNREFKAQVVCLVRERGVSVAHASGDIDAHENALCKWVKDFGSDPKQVVPSHGQQEFEQLESERLRHRMTKPKAERDNLKNAAAYFTRESI